MHHIGSGGSNVWLAFSAATVGRLDSSKNKAMAITRFDMCFSSALANISFTIRLFQRPFEEEKLEIELFEPCVGHEQASSNCNVCC